MFWDFNQFVGYNWRSGKLDPSFMNVAEGKEKLLPHLIKVFMKTCIRNHTRI